ncbi:MAG: malate/lactate/ureidoglycolate dehydrogenase [Betaproteobacteria bacterium]
MAAEGKNEGEGITIHAEPLRAVVQAIVGAGGSSAREAELVATQLVEANLTGHDSHGVGMVPRYVEALLEGSLHINQHLRVVSEIGPLLTVDGNAGYGQVMGHEAMECGIAIAAAHGVAVVGLANSHHIGRIGHWAEQCIAAGYVSMHYVNVISEPVVAPFGGRDARFVTNPFCVGVPLPDSPPVLLDFATSRIAMGKVRVAMNTGQQVAAGTLLDSAGEPTTDPHSLFADPHGAILPFGEHKGYALAGGCEILGGALTGGATLRGKPPNRAIINNMLSIIIDPQRMGTAGNLAAESPAFLDWVRQSPVQAGIERVKTPGEPERDYRRQRAANGIWIDATTWSQIENCGMALGVEPGEVDRLRRAI